MRRKRQNPAGNRGGRGECYKIRHSNRRRKLPMSETALRFTGVVKNFGRAQALRGVTFDVAPASFSAWLA
jgi:hypothetical protein